MIIQLSNDQLLEGVVFRALTMASAEKIGEAEVLERLACVLADVSGGWVAPTRASVLAAGAVYISDGVSRNPFSGESHQCLRGNFSFWSYWLKDPVAQLACTLHVIRPTSDEIFSWVEPNGFEDSCEAIAAMRRV